MYLYIMLTNCLKFLPFEASFAGPSCQWSPGMTCGCCLNQLTLSRLVNVTGVIQVCTAYAYVIFTCSFEQTELYEYGYIYIYTLFVLHF